MFLSIFKMMLNAERCSVLPSSTVLLAAAFRRMCAEYIHHIQMVSGSSPDGVR